MLFMDEPMRAWYVETSMTIFAYSSQAHGYFGDASVSWAKGGFDGPPPHGPQYDTPTSRRRLLKAIETAGAKGCTVNQVALAYLLNQPMPLHAIIGTTKPERVRDAIAAPFIELTQAECESLRNG